jgi:hypothetical protein
MFHAGSPTVQPQARVVRSAADEVLVELPSQPILPAQIADPYQRLLAGIPELLPDLAQGVRVGDYPSDSNVRGAPRRGGMTDDELRAYVAEKYGPENAGLISSPYGSFREGSASPEEKANWSR